MRVVKLTLNDKTYEKTNPTIDDWFLNLDAAEKIEGKNLITDIVAARTAVEIVSKFLNAPLEDIYMYGDLELVLEAYHQIQRNIVDAFLKAQEIWGKNVEAPAE